MKLKMMLAALAAVAFACHHTENVTQIPVAPAASDTTQTASIVYSSTAQAPKPVAEPVKEVASGVTACGEDLNCFVAEVWGCKPASASHTATVEMSGIKQTTRSYLEIRGPEAGRCAFYLRAEKIDIQLPADAPPETASLQKQIIKLLEGRDGVCRMTAADLGSMLTRWSEGKYSPDDFKQEDCTGPYFAKEL